MNRTFHIAMTVLVSCCVFSFAQTSTPSTEEKQQAPPAASSDKKQEPPAPNSNTQGPTRPDTAKVRADYGLGLGTKPTESMGPIDVLTDTMGVDFGPYLQKVLRDIRKNWYNLIPEQARAPLMKKGKVTIEFAILKDGKVAGMQLVSTSGDVGLDRGAWGGITASNPFPPLPTEFGGQYIGLRFAFYYNPDKADLVPPASPTGQSSSKSGIKVSIWQPYGAEVPIGESVTVVATVTGSTNTAVKWSITGSDCSGSACGIMNGDLYQAPKVLPSPRSVVLTATSKADKTASAWVTVHVVQPNSNTEAPTQPDTAKVGPDYGLGMGKKPTAAIGPVEVLTDTMGVDFGPYLQRVLHDVRMNWYNLVPEQARAPLMMKGKVVIEFAILEHGNVAGMRLVSPSGNVALDRGAWGGITASNPFPPLPSEFSGPFLGLRLPFFYNPDRVDLAGAPASPTGQSSSKSGIKVSISPTDGGKVPIGGFEVVNATVTGSNNTAVKWSITGVGCSGSACGIMSGDMYLAPKVLPSPPSVVLTATSEADSTASASVKVELVQPDSPR
jgi:TonB family protein